MKHISLFIGLLLVTFLNCQTATACCEGLDDKSYSEPLDDKYDQVGKSLRNVVSCWAWTTGKFNGLIGSIAFPYPAEWLYKSLYINGLEEKVISEVANDPDRNIANSSSFNSFKDKIRQRTAFQACPSEGAVFFDALKDYLHYRALSYTPAQ